MPRGATSPPLLERRSARACAGPSSAPASARRSSSRHQGYRATYAELWEQVDRAARALIAHGVGKGDRVGIWAPNRYEWVVTQFATARVGAILVTINPAYKAAELRYALDKAGVSLLVMAPRLPRHRLRGDARRGPRRLPALRETIVLEDDWERVPGRRRPRRRRARWPRARRRCSSTTRSTSSTRRARPARPRARRSRTATSSTTRYFAGRALGYTEHDRVVRAGALLPLLRHGARHASRAPTHGACMVVPGESFDAAAVLATVEAERCTSLYGVPTMFIAELAAAGLRRASTSSSLRTGDDGRRAVPGRGHAAGAHAHAHGRGRRSCAA